ncbi:hypothetical protein COCON_G00007420 [Conger conger]|uniref:Uncharacterized protein n=1 Tax=Conger conger TaxID=82655 RepID=A0A9Q1E1Z4_CONCO|nr:hypothetical protein COCON_G00007420 [Conger conger]
MPRMEYWGRSSPRRLVERATGRLGESRYITIEKESRHKMGSLVLPTGKTLCPLFGPCSSDMHRMKDTNNRFTQWYLALLPFSLLGNQSPRVCKRLC